MKRRRPGIAVAGAALAAALGYGLALLVACGSTDRGFADPPAETGPDRVQFEAATYDAPPVLDAADDYEVPDGGVFCDASPCVLALTGAAGAYCALRTDGTVSCWGNNMDGQLALEAGADPVLASGTASTVRGLGGITSVGVGDGNTCARLADGGVFCWGNADLVNAGIAPADGGSPLDTPVVAPTRQSAVPPAQALGVGTHAACITSPAGIATCWGKNASAELARPAGSDPVAPAPIALGGRTVAAVLPADSRTFAITTAGELVSWGASTISGSGGYLLGRDTSEDPDAVPHVVPGLTHVRAVATGGLHTCAIVGRFVECWGADGNGQLGRGQYTQLSYLPGATRLAFVVEAEDIDAGGAVGNDIPLHVASGDGHSCAVMGSGRVYCWGGNDSGQLGATIPSSNSGYPVRIRDLSGPAVQLAAGHRSTCALLRAGTIECWGANDQGDLGRGSIDDLPHPHPRMVELPP